MSNNNPISKLTPCKGCEKRHMTCHSSCEDYLKFKEQKEKEREARFLASNSFYYRNKNGRG